MNDIFIRYIEMPFVAKGCTIEDENGDYNIYINITRDPIVQRKALKHELDHLRGNDFNNNLHITEVEEF